MSGCQFPELQVLAPPEDLAGVVERGKLSQIPGGLYVSIQGKVPTCLFTSGNSIILMRVSAEDAHLIAKILTEIAGT